MPSSIEEGHVIAAGAFEGLGLHDVTLFPQLYSVRSSSFWALGIYT